MIPRKGRRLTVSLPSRLVYCGTREAAAEVGNLSFYGFRAACDAEVARGDFVSIALPVVGLVRARVAWRKAGALGAVFLKPVDIRTFLRPRPDTRAA